MTLPPSRSDGFMDDLFGAMESADAPLDADDAAREDEAVEAVLARLGLVGDGLVPIPHKLPADRPPATRLLVYAALAAALLVGMFLGRALLPSPEGPVATVALPAPSAASVVITAPSRSETTAVEPSAELPVPSELAEPASPTPTAELPRPAVPTEGPADPSGEISPEVEPPPVRLAVLTDDPGPGVALGSGTRLSLDGRTGVLEHGSLTFRRQGDVQPLIDRVHFPALDLYALPVGTVFAAAAVRNLALVYVTEGEVHLVQEDGTRVGSVRASESVAIGPAGGAGAGLLMVSTEGTDAAGLAVLLPEVSADEREIEQALVALRLRTVPSQLVRDVLGLEDLDE